jgi:hypothetical protein
MADKDLGVSGEKLPAGDLVQVLQGFADRDEEIRRLGSDIDIQIACLGGAAPREGAEDPHFLDAEGIAPLAFEIAERRQHPFPILERSVLRFYRSGHGTCLTN